MGGSYKKKQRAEKAKVKLKGVQLPKGLNVTKTEFKVRKITIRQQQQDERSFIDGQRVINMKEVMARLKHHSPGAKAEALRNLREAIECQHSEVKTQRAAIVQSIAAMCLETEQEPRRESFRTLSVLLANLSDEQEIAPFFHIISSYLRCAMTHITQTLQEDSLLMLDVLLEHVPRQVAADSERILQNFLEMISRVRAEGDQAGRMLMLHVGNKQTSVKWRSKVLQRLQQMLHTLTEHNEQCSMLKDNSGPSLHTFTLQQPHYYTLKRAFNAGDHASLFSTTSAQLAESGVQKQTVALRSYIQHLMPLLFDSWLEVRPQTTELNATILLSTEAATTLHIVLEIMISLWTLVQQHEITVKHNDLTLWFQQQYVGIFATNFMSKRLFPYQALEQKQKRNKLLSDVSAQACLRQNMRIVQLMCLFYKLHNGAGQQAAYPLDQFLALIEYVSSLLLSIQKYKNADAVDCQSLLGALRALLLDNAPRLLQQHALPMLLLLRTTINAYLSNDFPQCDNLTADVLVLLCEIAESPALFEAYGGREQFALLLQQLPKMLLKPAISERALLAMTRLGKQQNPIFIEALESQIDAVIPHIQRLQVQGASNVYEGRRHVMNLFYWTARTWRKSPTKLSHLLGLLEQYVPDKRIASYFKFILT